MAKKNHAFKIVALGEDCAAVMRAQELSRRLTAELEPEYEISSDERCQSNSRAGSSSNLNSSEAGGVPPGRPSPLSQFDAMRSEPGRMFQANCPQPQR